jgi:MIP family channel proteins
MRDSWRHFIAEFIGTFALVFVGSGAIIRAANGGGSLGEIALAHGLILSVMVTALMRISGHFNPAVTAGFLVVRRIEPVMAVVYWIAQFMGAIAAAYALKGLLPPQAVEATRVGGQSVAVSISFSAAVVLEAIATFFLAWVIFGTAVDPDAPRVGGFAIGLTIAADILVIGPYTGASMNPARSLGPAIASGVFEAQGVYFIGPLIGAILAAVLYDRLFLRRGPEPVDHGAVAP